MNLKNAKFSILKFRPSAVLDEQVNIGILVFFEQDNVLQFIYPQTLTRLRALFPKIDLDRIKTLLVNFENRIDEYNKKENVKLEFETIRDEHLLIPDDNSLFFSQNFDTGYSDKEALINHYTDRYFSSYYSKNY